jgi:hypothetical protein
LPVYIPDIKILLNRNVNEGASWNLPAISISFVINCNPLDLFLLSFLIGYFKLRRIYNKIRKYKMKNFKKSILSQLDNLNNNNPKAYWKLIESLKDKDNDALPNCNPLDLFLLSFLIADRTSSSEMLKSNSLKFKLSFSFSKSFCSRFKSCYLNTFCGAFNDLKWLPGNWSRGYISPIFKSGDRSKPDNYRGIAITDCLSKLLNSILNSRLDIFLIDVEVQFIEI